MADVNNAIVVACSFDLNQLVRYSMIPGKNPASATPSKNLKIYNCVVFCANPVSTETIPHVIKIRAIQTLAPNRCIITLLGTSKIK